MANLTTDQSSNIPRLFKKILLEQMKGQQLLDSDELSLFEWYAQERTKTIDLMVTEETAFIKQQVDAGLDLGDVNDSGMVAVEYYIKRARHADVIYLTSLLELYLSRASKKLQEILGDHNVTFRPGELAGNKWVRHKKFIEGYGKFAFPDDAWSVLLTLIDVRNILVHENGDTTAIKKPDILDRIKKSPGLRADRGEIVIEDAYLTHCLSAFHSLVERINSQINQSIERTLQPQGLKPAKSLSG
ncbi:MAG: hypothetical protein ACLQUZ_01735 [Rhizomicrobium sp.]